MTVGSIFIKIRTKGSSRPLKSVSGEPRRSAELGRAPAGKSLWIAASGAGPEGLLL